jgi:hypothetical protein
MNSPSPHQHETPPTYRNWDDSADPCAPSAEPDPLPGVGVSATESDAEAGDWPPAPAREDEYEPL